MRNYTPDEMNTIFSLILTEVVEQEELDNEDGMFIKSIFNTFLDVIANQPDTAEAILEEGHAMEEEYKQMAQSEADDDRDTMEQKIWDSLS